MKSRQSGITLVGFLFLLLVFGFFAFMAMKLVPAYVSYFSLSKAMTQVATEGVDGKTQNDVRRDFMFKLSFQYADQLITPQNIKFTRVEDGTDMHVAYDQRIPFISNIDFLLHFDKTVKLKGNLY